MTRFHYQCKFRTRDDIQAEVDKLIDTHNPTRQLPIDVDLMAEKLGLEIIPMQLPWKIDALVNANLQILVNNQRYSDTRYESRMRFAIAHELGHFILHREAIEQTHFDSIEEFIHFNLEIPEKQYRNFEFQANEFAGRLLVPRQQLRKQMLNITSELLNECASLEGIDRSQLFRMLMDRFQVSEDCLLRVFSDEKIWQWFENLEKTFD